MLSRTSNTTFVKSFSLSALIAVALSVSVPANADSTYGPVKSSDTLSKILKRIYNGPRASQKAVMKQIVADNPNAFLNSDMNRLKLNASLTLRGDFWKGAQNSSIQKASGTTRRIVTTDLIDRSATELTVEQMKGRIVFLDAERSSLIQQVAELKQETVRLANKVQRLESASMQSDEQLRTLDAEIIRLTQLLSSKNNDVKVSNADLNQLVVLQEKLRLVQNETSALRTELERTQKKLSSNDNASNQTNQTITQLTKENEKLQKLLQDAQPGVHYYNDTNSDYELSFMSGKFQFPLGLIVVGGALLALMLTALFATRRKRKTSSVVTENKSIDPFEDNHAFSKLLETENHGSRGFAQSHTHPEENVFKMFDEGSLEMDLKLDMAEAYLQVSDLESARLILQEVVVGGSELQKRKAKGLINRAA